MPAHAHKEPPKDLRRVAYVFIFAGIMGVLDTAMALTGGRIRPNPLAVGLLIGPGLLLLSRIWREVAVIALWGWFATVGCIAYYYVFGGGADASWGPGHWVLAAVVFAASIAVAVWMYRVLARPDTRALFGEEED